MKALWLILALSLALPRAALAACPDTPARSGPVDLPVGSTIRTFVLRVPSGYDGSTPAPVVIAFHPGGSNAQYMQARFNITKVWPDALALYPEGLGRTTEAGQRPSWQTKQGEMDNRDIAFFDAMRAWVLEKHCVDEKRIFVMGYSNGAMLSSVLACERAKDIAAFALLSGSLNCQPAMARPVIIGHGLQDVSVSYERGVAMMQEWSAKNSCATPPATGGAGCSAAASCSAPLVLCTHAGGHEYDLGFTAEVASMFKSVK